MKETIVTKKFLKAGFESLGVTRDMKLIVHSSLKSFGCVEGGADCVIDTICEILGDGGTLMMPSFNHGEPYYNGDIFDVNKTPTTNGIIPETFRKRKGVLRSINPTHPFSVWGKDKERYTKDHQKYDAFGIGSPLYRLMEDGGYCMLIGTGYKANTFHHLVETCEASPCLLPKGEVYPVKLYDGTVADAHTWSWRDGICPINYNPIYPPLMKDIEKRVKIGNAEVILYNLKKGYDVIASCLNDGAVGGIKCSDCKIRPRVCKWSVDK
ncbi:MAG: AAC(3) family N-acetyltransferase [Clostridia bacterium]|nr:AAC(3) family N-acetyltransferase [Clostridia bacterium]